MRRLFSALGLICLLILAYTQQMTFVLAQDASVEATDSITTPPADPIAGAKVFRKCRACHMVGAKAVNRVGPHLNGIIGGGVAQVEGFKYSKALLAYAKDQPTWTQDALHAYLTKPALLVKGGRMAFAGLKKAKDRDNLIAYLKQFSAPSAPSAP